MIILGSLIFGFCLWAVFSRHFCDGIVAKHFLSFSAITAMLVILDPENTGAAFTSVGLLLLAMAYWFFKHHQLIKKRINRLQH